MRRVDRVARSRPAHASPARWVAWVAVAVAAFGVVQLPSVAQAGPADNGAAGLHDTMLPPDSPDAKGDPGLSADTRARTLAAAAGQLLGVDVSHYQNDLGPIDWNQVAASGQSFAIVKATEGVGWTDPDFRQNIDGAAAAGLVVGAYTYAHPETDPIQQADYFADTVGALPQGSLPPVLDLESTGGLDPAGLVSWTHQFLDELEFRTGFVPMIYTSPSWYEANLSNSTDFGRYPLWEAHYTTAASPYQIGAWPTYNLWQYTSSASVGGISGNVDESRFNGSVDDLRALRTSSGMPAIAARANAPGTAAALGPATTGIVCGLIQGGCGQHFTNSASIYWSPSTGAHVVSGAIRGLWAALGWEWNLGYPTMEMVCGLRDGGCGQAFSADSTVYWSPGTGSHEVRGAIRDVFSATGAEHGPLGYPTTGQFCGLRGGGCGQHFQGGSIYWSPGSGAHVVSGGIRGLWAALGWEGNLGYPTMEMVCGLRDGGCGQAFSADSTVYWSPGTGSHEVRGAIRDVFSATGAEHGPLGYPTTGQFCGLRGGGCGQHFQGGSIYWSPATGAHAVAGATRAVWSAAGWEGGRYGYPIGDAYPSGRYWYQRFQYGTIRT